MLEDERLEGGKRDGYNRRQQVFHTLQQIDKSFQRPQKLCRFNQITGQNSEFSLSRNVPIQKFGCTIIVSKRRWVDIMFCLSSVFVHFFFFSWLKYVCAGFTCMCMPWTPVTLKYNGARFRQKLHSYSVDRTPIFFICSVVENLGFLVDKFRPIIYHFYQP